MNHHLVLRPHATVTLQSKSPKPALDARDRSAMLKYLLRSTYSGIDDVIGMLDLVSYPVEGGLRSR